MYNPQLVKFQTTDNLGLPGLLYEPKKKINKVAIFLHGCGSTSVFYKAKLMNTLAKDLNKQSIAFFPFNNRGAHYIKSLKRKQGDEEEQIMMGTTYELLKDCIHDIDGAINFLKIQGYKKFYLIGHSTGANKIVVYNYYKKNSPFTKYILLGGGDDTGLYYQMMGKKKFFTALHRAKQELERDNGTKFVPKYLVKTLYSWQSLYDTINPDGDYNTFPFNEYMNNLKLSTKPLFHQYKCINKPTLVVYGENDEYCYGNVLKCVEVLKQNTSHPKLVRYEIIPQTDHSFTGKEQELAESIATWLVK
jgi:pimeloyl-ACP methyl ester carboxylesterase